MAVVCDPMRMGRWSELMVVCVCHLVEVVQIQPLALRQSTAYPMNVPNANILYTGALASDVFEAGVP